jgi:hypothetical protein
MTDFLHGFAKTAGDIPPGDVPRVAIKTHLDGDPALRPDEMADWNALRLANDMDEMIALVLTPNDADPEEASPGTAFPGYDLHWWKISDAGVEPTEVEFTIVPDLGVRENFGGGKQ